MQLRPILDSVDQTKSEDEIKRERLTRQRESITEVINTFEDNRPFYSSDVHKQVQELVKVSQIEAISYQHGNQISDKYWLDAENNAK